MKLYSLESYDDDFTLKVSPGSAFWLAFLCRALVIMPFDLYFKKKSFDFMGIFYATNVHLSVAVISALPTLAVLVAWIRRHSSAGSVPRFIWANGKSLLIVSAILNLLGILWSVTSRESISNLDLTQIVLSFSCLFYVLRSQRLRDTFLSFPALSEYGGKQR
tara:strand:- start:54 stop:539 length:486 start_codon:yes stop_codon:yes gene_type:complete